jgi:hypothetical protein
VVARENLFLLAGAGPVAPTAAAAGTHRPVTGTRLTDGLLHRWQQRSRTASLPLALRQLQDAGNLDNVRLAGGHVDDLAGRPSAVLGERPVTLPGIGQTIEVTADGCTCPRPPRPPRFAIPYFQWDNRDGHAMRVWVPRAEDAAL